MSPLHNLTAAAAAISPEVAAHVLHHFEAGGRKPGSFTGHLLHAIQAADPGNQARLAMGFPEHVLAVQLATQYEGGIAALTARTTTGAPPA